MTVELIQGTHEWAQARLGKVTASRIADVLAKTKTGYGAMRANYMGQLIAERLTGVAAESYVSKEMQWGTDHEPHARELYEFRTEADIAQVGFVDHPRLAMSGASPDGLVSADGLVEIKCPNTSTHIDTLIAQEIPAKYEPQMQWQMACTGRLWCDFVSFDPRMPSHLRLFVKRLARSDAYIAETEAEIARFLAELDGKVEALRERYEQREAA